jgi:hypothetical protein
MDENSRQTTRPDREKALEAAVNARWDALLRLNDLVNGLRTIPEDTPEAAVNALDDHLETLLDEVIETHQILQEIIGRD